MTKRRKEKINKNTRKSDEKHNYHLFYLQINHYYFNKLNNAILCYVYSERGWGECWTLSQNACIVIWKGYLLLIFLCWNYPSLWGLSLVSGSVFEQFRIYTISASMRSNSNYYKISQIISLERTIVKEFFLHYFQFSTQFLSTYR